MPANRDRDKFTDHEIAFVEAYLGEGRLNIARSARLAGYTEKTFRKGYELIRMPHVRKEIQRRMQERFKLWGIESERVLLELCAIAFADIGKVAQWSKDGIILEDSDTLPLAVRMGIKSVHQVVSKYGVSIRVEMHDKMKALEILARHIGLVDSNNGDDEGKTQFAIWADRQRQLYSGEYERDQIKAEIAEAKQELKALKAKRADIEQIG